MDPFAPALAPWAGGPRSSEEDYARARAAEAEQPDEPGLTLADRVQRRMMALQEEQPAPPQPAQQDGPVNPDRPWIVRDGGFAGTAIMPWAHVEEQDWWQQPLEPVQRAATLDAWADDARAAIEQRIKFPTEEARKRELQDFDATVKERRDRILNTTGLPDVIGVPLATAAGVLKGAGQGGASMIATAAYLGGAVEAGARRLLFGESFDKGNRPHLEKLADDYSELAQRSFDETLGTLTNNPRYMEGPASLAVSGAEMVGGLGQAIGTANKLATVRGAIIPFVQRAATMGAFAAHGYAPALRELYGQAKAEGKDPSEVAERAKIVAGGQAALFGLSGDFGVSRVLTRGARLQHMMKADTLRAATADVGARKAVSVSQVLKERGFLPRIGRTAGKMSVAGARGAADMTARIMGGDELKRSQGFDVESTPQDYLDTALVAFGISAGMGGMHMRDAKIAMRKQALPQARYVVGDREAGIESLRGREGDPEASRTAAAFGEHDRLVRDANPQRIAEARRLTSEARASGDAELLAKAADNEVAVIQDVERKQSELNYRIGQAHTVLETLGEYGKSEKEQAEHNAWVAWYRTNAREVENFAAMREATDQRLGITKLRSSIERLEGMKAADPAGFGMDAYLQQLKTKMAVAEGQRIGALQSYARAMVDRVDANPAPSFYKWWAGTTGEVNVPRAETTPAPRVEPEPAPVEAEVARVEEPAPVEAAKTETVSEPASQRQYRPNIDALSTLEIRRAGEASGDLIADMGIQTAKPEGERITVDADVLARQAMADGGRMEGDLISDMGIQTRTAKVRRVAAVLQARGVQSAEANRFALEWADRNGGEMPTEAEREAALKDFQDAGGRLPGDVPGVSPIETFLAEGRTMEEARAAVRWFTEQNERGVVEANENNRKVVDAYAKRERVAEPERQGQEDGGAQADLPRIGVKQEVGTPAQEPTPTTAAQEPAPAESRVTAEPKERTWLDEALAGPEPKDPTAERRESIAKSLDDASDAAEAQAKEWDSRVYRVGTAVVEFVGDGPSKRGFMSVNEINEARRAKKVAYFRKVAKNISDLAQALRDDPATIQSVERYIAQAKSAAKREVDARKKGQGQTKGERSLRSLEEGYLAELLFGDQYRTAGKDSAASKVLDAFSKRGQESNATAEVRRAAEVQARMGAERSQEPAGSREREQAQEGERPQEQAPTEPAAEATRPAEEPATPEGERPPIRETAEDASAQALHDGVAQRIRELKGDPATVGWTISRAERLVQTAIKAAERATPGRDAFVRAYNKITDDLLKNVEGREDRNPLLVAGKGDTPYNVIKVAQSAARDRAVDRVSDSRDAEGAPPDATTAPNQLKALMAKEAIAEIEALPADNPMRRVAEALWDGVGKDTGTGDVRGTNYTAISEHLSEQGPKISARQAKKAHENLRAFLLGKGHGPASVALESPADTAARPLPGVWGRIVAAFKGKGKAPQRRDVAEIVVPAKAYTSEAKPEGFIEIDTSTGESGSEIRFVTGPEALDAGFAPTDARAAHLLWERRLYEAKVKGYWDRDTGLAVEFDYAEGAKPTQAVLDRIRQVTPLNTETYRRVLRAYSREVAAAQAEFESGAKTLEQAIDSLPEPLRETAKANLSRVKPGSTVKDLASDMSGDAASRAFFKAMLDANPSLGDTPVEVAIDLKGLDGFYDGASIRLPLTRPGDRLFNALAHEVTHNALDAAITADQATLPEGVRAGLRALEEVRLAGLAKVAESFPSVPQEILDAAARGDREGAAKLFSGWINTLPDALYREAVDKLYGLIDLRETATQLVSSRAFQRFLSGVVDGGTAKLQADLRGIVLGGRRVDPTSTLAKGFEAVAGLARGVAPSTEAPPVSRETPQPAPRASFAGEQTLDLLPPDERVRSKLLLKRAQGMAERAGLPPDFADRKETRADNERIRLATGWFKLPDGTWAYEFGDVGMTVLKERGHGKLGEFIEHDAFFKRYPKLSNIPVAVHRGESPTGEVATYADGHIHVYPKDIAREGTTFAKAVLHEMQHAAQEVEGWLQPIKVDARGNITNMRGTAKNVGELMTNSQHEIMARAAVERMDGAQEGFPLDSDPYRVAPEDVATFIRMGRASVSPESSALILGVNAVERALKTFVPPTIKPGESAIAFDRRYERARAKHLIEQESEAVNRYIAAIEEAKSQRKDSDAESAQEEVGPSRPMSLLEAARTLILSHERNPHFVGDRAIAVAEGRASVAGESDGLSWSDVFTVDFANGKWYINRREAREADKNRGRPFASEKEAVERATQLLPEERNTLRERSAEAERVASRSAIKRNADVDAIADKNIVADIDPIEGSTDGRALVPGEIVNRVVWEITKGQGIQANSLDRIGVEGDSKTVFGLHIGDSTYWRKRLNADYERRGGRTVNIRVAEGDRIVEDPQYVTDPDTGIKADSWILLTPRKSLKYGTDWVFDGEKFADEGAKGGRASIAGEPTPELQRQRDLDARQYTLDPSQTTPSRVLESRRDHPDFPPEWKEKLKSARHIPHKEAQTNAEADAWIEGIGGIENALAQLTKGKDANRDLRDATFIVALGKSIDAGYGLAREMKGRDNEARESLLQQLTDASTFFMSGGNTYDTANVYGQGLRAHRTVADMFPIEVQVRSAYDNTFRRSRSRARDAHPEIDEFGRALGRADREGSETAARRVTEFVGGRAGAPEAGRIAARMTNDYRGFPIPEAARAMAVDMVSAAITERLSREARRADGSTPEEPPPISDVMVAEIRGEVSRQMDILLKGERQPRAEQTPEQKLADIFSGEFTRQELIDLSRGAFNQVVARLRGGEFADAIPPEYTPDGMALSQFEGDLLPEGVARQVKRFSDIHSLARQSLSARRAEVGRVLDAIDEIYEETGRGRMDTGERQLVERTLREIYGREIRKAAEGSLKAMVQQIDARGKQVPKSAFDKMLELMNLGAFTDDRFSSILAGEYGFPVADPELTAKFHARAEEIQSTMTPDSVQRDQAVQELMADIARAHIEQAIKTKGERAHQLADVLSSVWIAGILSGPPTHVVNTFASALSGGIELMAQAVGRYADARKQGLTHGQAAEFFRDIFRAWEVIVDPDSPTGLRSPAMNEAEAAITQGTTTRKSTKQENFGGLELYRMKEGEALWKSALKAVPLTARYIGRAMLAQDAVTAGLAQSGAAWMFVRSEAIKRGLRGRKLDDFMATVADPENAALNNAIAQATREREQGQFGDDPKKAENLYRRRVQQLRDRERFGADIVDRATKFGARVTYNEDPTGVMGFFASKIAEWNAALGVTKPLAPFPRTMANIANQFLDWTPYGVMRAHNKGFLAGLASRGDRASLADKFSHERVEKGSPEYYAALTRSAVGTLGLGLAWLALMGAQKDKEEGREPWFDITGNGPGGKTERDQLRQTGKWSPFSFKIGKARFAYSDLPGVGMALAALGAYADNVNYGNLEEKSMFDKLWVPAVGSVAMLGNKAMFSGFTNLFQLLSEPDAQKGAAAKRLLLSYPSGLTNPQLFKWLTGSIPTSADLSAGVADRSTDRGAMLALIPFASYFDLPKLNLLAEPIRNPIWDPTLRRFINFNEVTQAHPILSPLTEAGVLLSAPTKRAIIHPFTGRKHIPEGDQNYHYRRITGEEYARVFTKPVADRLLALSRSGANGRIAAIKTGERYEAAARDRAKIRYFREVVGAGK